MNCWERYLKEEGEVGYESSCSVWVSRVGLRVKAHPSIRLRGFVNGRKSALNELSSMAALGCLYWQ